LLREVNGWRTRVVDIGSGEKGTLVTHGGWTGSWELWEQQVEALSRDGWRVVAYDHRGSGFSRLDPSEISLEALVDDLFALLDQLEVEECVLAGESMGTAVVLLAALRAPERFQGLVLVAGNGVWRRVSLLPFLFNLTVAYRLTLRIFVAMAVPEREDRAYYRRWGLSILRQAQPRAARRLIRSLVGLDLRPRLGEVSTPTLVIHGTRDLLVMPRDGKAMARALPNARLRWIPGAGHVPTLTRPDVVSGAIAEFANSI
jgi:pimeloyl-ACP methyl ester carboxylesterase